MTSLIIELKTMARPKATDRSKTTILTVLVASITFIHCYYIFENHTEKKALMTESSHGSSLADRYLYHEDWPASRIEKAHEFVLDYQIPNTIKPKKDAIE